MAEKVYLFVDNSNVLIEGRRLQYAVRRSGGRRGVEVDPSYEIDWGKFLDLVKTQGGRMLGTSPMLYGSRPPPDDSIWEQIRKEGFTVKVFDRNGRNEEKGVDAEMIMDVMELILSDKEPGTLVIAAGDGDYPGLIERVLKRKWKVEVWFWENAALKVKNSTTFYCLDPALTYIKKNGGVALPPTLSSRKPSPASERA